MGFSLLSPERSVCFPRPKKSIGLQPLVHVNWSEVKLLSRVRLFATPWTVAYQAPLSMVFSMQEYWSGLPFPSPGDLPDPGIEPRSPALYADALPSEPPKKSTWAKKHFKQSITKDEKIKLYYLLCSIWKQENCGGPWIFPDVLQTSNYKNMSTDKCP